MILERLSIHRRDYGELEGKFIGTVEFNGQTGSVKLVLTPDLSERLLAVIADELEAVAKEAANSLRIEVVASQVKP